MKILDRYLAKTLLKYSLSVMVILVGIFAFFKFLEEVDSIGRVNYMLSDAIIYIALLLPSMAHMLSSLIILLGAILGLGNLASHSELVIMRSSGLSVIDVTKTTLKISVFFAFVMIVVGEFLTPISSNYAEQYRAAALGQRIVSSSQQGFWIKDDHNFIRVDKNIDGKIFNDITLIKTNKDNNKLDMVLQGKSAEFDGDNIVFDQSKILLINSDEKFVKFNQEVIKNNNVQVDFDQELIQSLKKEPKELSTLTLFKHIVFLTKNQLSSDIYEVELYARLMKPFTLIAMIILSIPFEFGSLRDSSLGRKIFLGVTISLFFELSSRIGGMLSLRFDFNHLLSASLPMIVVLIVALILLRRVAVR